MVGKEAAVAVLSGKGGTGKTLVSVNLASAASAAAYFDCDVEEPNGHLFFKPVIFSEEAVTVKVPEINADCCTGCRKCVDFCAFHALAFVENRPILFDEVCHSCGGCALLCPQGAIRETEKTIGTVSTGMSGNIAVHTGSLKIGEASGTPVIKRLRKKIPYEESRCVFIDCPPGSSCAVMESILYADFCVLVAEPTVFGAHNLAMVYDLVNLFQKPYGVVLNKCLEGENPSEVFCLEHHSPILGRIPFDSELGMLNSEGKIAVRERERFRVLCDSLLRNIGKGSHHEAASDS
ncbi:MAG: ATP-binding protein [Lawsonibacter sp.]|nr:ATP-binding protein [Lawsonibacter sp.]